MKNLKKFIKKKNKFPSTEITSDKTWSKLETRSVGLLYAGEKGHDFDIYMALKSDLKGVKFFHTFDKNYIEKNGGVQISLYKGPEGKIDYTGDYNHEDIMNWVTANRYGIIMSIEHPDAIRRVFDSMHHSVIFFSKGDDLESKEFIPFIANAKKFKSANIAFIYAQEGGETTEEFAEYVGVESYPQLGAIKVVNDEDMDKFMYSGDWTTEAVEKWVQSFINNELEKHFRSEPIPQDNNGAVKHVVGHNFKDLVFDEEKHIFVMFYAPWCRHCKKVSRNLKLVCPKI